jgi:hypothetical protein
MKLIIALTLLCFQIKAADVAGPYTVFDSIALTSAAETLTVQQVINGTTDIQLVEASMWCSVNTTFTLLINGTAATTTTLVPTTLNTWSLGPKAKAFKSSNVGSGTTVRTYPFTGGASEIVIDLSNILILRSAGTMGNISLKTSSVTGTCNLYFKWNEVR